MKAMAIESSMWKALRSIMPPTAHVVRVENRTGPGTPDVYVCHRGVSVWLELKTLHDWPVRAKTIVRVPHYTEHQKLWGQEHYRACGRSYVLLKVKKDWLLITSMMAQMYLGKVPKHQLFDIAEVFWEGRPSVIELRAYLFNGG